MPIPKARAAGGPVLLGVGVGPVVMVPALWSISVPLGRQAAESPAVGSAVEDRTGLGGSGSAIDPADVGPFAWDRVGFLPPHHTNVQIRDVLGLDWDAGGAPNAAADEWWPGLSSGENAQTSQADS